MAWLAYCKSQQDVAQSVWLGPVAAIEGDVDRQTETMEARVVVGTSRESDFSISFAVCVGGIVLNMIGGSGPPRPS